ncbi:heme oxygenase-like protein [Eremomyces bilateralis CBS 781.70]|uniref:Heme oxygenase-like protein n=1 Tax=Eremomyces bilateralis CBS 781.70 TaxID=1392243 RepID=A0A6G1GCS5_9PEZI|nr:heme oxygenase-like protein [Eremomyces bilateralis CBS 781.70]KAF1815659.1 heme oxygenase-like protein [Eremomyces bilateralis CBS 781.70]
MLRSKPPADAESFGAQINKATQSAHTKLNRLITSRLPLALPPHTSSPDLYANGILHFAHIFFTLEASIRDLLPSPTDGTRSPIHQARLKELLEDPWVNIQTYSDILAARSSQIEHAQTSPNLPPDDATSPPLKPNAVLLQMLSHLLPVGLHRTPTLQADLAYLLNIQPIDLSVSLSAYPSPAVQNICQRIRRVANEKPHVLLAYAWTFYLAIFSGGRWIRSQLVASGPGFWGADFDGESHPETDEKPCAQETKGLGLWCFEGGQDGEDIRAGFKSQFECIGNMLSEEQRVEVLEEAEVVFKACEDIVTELDTEFRNSNTTLGGTERATSKKYSVHDTPSGVLRNTGVRRVDWFPHAIAGVAVVASALGWYALGRSGVWT